ncbi:histone RNA hairpin-binding protein-like isoform X2 [Actinia tenebrosa]|uniref:Histone RNA hairpin-binding protein-like isoform X2 n=1 Tax=Actinia tenebrosa TaxID=6105 RepID=A0A6P8IVR5_ACTTE|nr:histone RNA hairpin-binding protein-like isoform X2 [Actinia tenebrosa]
MEVQTRAHSRSKRENNRGENQGSSGTRSSPRKRSYQREQRRGSNSAEHPLPNDDLRSPSHKQPRFKGQKENTPKNKMITNGDKKGPWNQKHLKNEKVELDNQEFPPLGFNFDRYTPESSKDWGTIVQEEEEKLVQCKENNRKSSKIKRRLMLYDTSEPTPKETTDDKSKPKNKVLRPIITDPHKLGQRQKQIEIGKNTVSYGNYIKNVPRENRSKEDPWTPDKFQQCSTRSWVGQVKNWRRRLHSYDTNSDTKDDLFSTSSTSSQNTDEIKMEDQQTQPKSKHITIEEMFQDFDLDSCLMEDDGLPL